MQLTQPRQNAIVRPAFRVPAPQPNMAEPSRYTMSTYVGDEIQAYAVIRDIALAEAEKITTSVNLERARIANEFVENCLKPARAPYEAQHLPDGDATRERQRCEAVKVRLALLRAHMNALSREQHVRAA